jgi:hypothetical protein
MVTQRLRQGDAELFKLYSQANLANPANLANLGMMREALAKPLSCGRLDQISDPSKSAFGCKPSCRTISAPEVRGAGPRRVPRLGTLSPQSISRPLELKRLRELLILAREYIGEGPGGGCLRRVDVCRRF